MARAAKFRIDVAIHDLLMNFTQQAPVPPPPQAKGRTLPAQVFPQLPERVNDPGPEAAPEKRKWGPRDFYRASRRWLLPYVRSRVLPGHFDQTQTSAMKSTCQRDCFSTLNHNLAYCYNDARVIKWLWSNAMNRFQGGVRSFED
jgi:hypothetical protein